VTGQVHLAIDDLLPSRGQLLARQGIPGDAPVRENVRALIDRSLGIVSSDADPKCLTADISPGDFDDIFRGEGLNDPEAPLKKIYPRADHLTLFALTMGEEVSRRISDFFQKNDFALGSMLDTAASLAVENAVWRLENLLAGELAGTGVGAGGQVVLNYSPGYCGWHISAQKKMFRHLRPERIGIKLNDSCLMAPLKSATGLLVHGGIATHNFDNGFGFCRTCKEQTCLERRDRLSGVHQSTV
jgi:hypothetical protein